MPLEYVSTIADNPPCLNLFFLNLDRISIHISSFSLLAGGGLGSGLGSRLGSRLGSGLGSGLSSGLLLVILIIVIFIVVIIILALLGTLVVLLGFRFLGSGGLLSLLCLSGREEGEECEDNQKDLLEEVHV